MRKTSFDQPSGPASSPGGSKVTPSSQGEEGQLARLRAENLRLRAELEKYKRIEAHRREALGDGRDEAALFRALVEYSHEGIIIVGDNHRMVFANEQFSHLVGVPLDEVLGSDFRDYLDEASLALVTDRYVRRRRGEEVPHRYEFNIRRRDGETRRVEMISAVVAGESPGEIRTVAQILDITPRHQAQTALAESERRYRFLTEAVADVIWTRGLEMKFTYVSPSVKTLRGYTEEEAMDQSLEEILTPDSYYRFKLTLESVIDSIRQNGRIAPDIYNAGMTMELEMRCKDGSTVWTEVRAKAITDGKGCPTGLIGVTRDITDRKNAEEGKLEKERLQAAVETAGAACHKLNQPLQYIIIRLEMMLMQMTEDEALHPELSDLLQKCQELAGITRQLSRITFYQTKSYVGDASILDLEKSSGH